MKKTAWLALLLCTCVLFVAPHCSTTQTPAPTLPPPPVDASSVCVTLGPDGGTITHASGAELVVPAGALDAPTSLCLAGVAAPAADKLGAVPLAQAYDASPAGQTFHKPIEVVLPFDPARLSPGASATNVELRMAPQETSDFVSMVSSVDLAKRTVRARTVHFTQFVPALNPNPVFITSPTSLPLGTVGTAYAQPFSASGGTAPYTWSLSPSSATPPGLTLDPAGALGGTPTVPSNFAFFVVAADSASHVVQEAFALTILAPSNAVPVLTSIAPATVPQGSTTTTVTLTGSGFAPTAQALWDGAAMATTFVSATQLSAAIPATNLVSAGAHAIAVSNPPPGGGTSASLTFTISAVAQNPVPTITAVSPTQLPVSNVDTQIAITGTNFIATSSAAIGNQGISTSYVSPTSLMATVPAANLAAAGLLQIDVYNPPPGGGFSPTSITVTVGTLAPVPTLSSLSPSSIDAGSGAFTLTVSGAGFVSGGQLFFGSTALATNVASDTSANATVPAYLVATAGTAQILFVNPTPGGGASAPLTFTIQATDAGGLDATVSDSGDDATDTGSDATSEGGDGGDGAVCAAAWPTDPGPCGGLGAACCTGNACNAPLSCVAGVCGQTCGNPGEACCGGNTCAGYTNPALWCFSGWCGYLSLTTAGQVGAPCSNGTCGGGLSCITLGQSGVPSPGSNLCVYTQPEACLQVGSSGCGTCCDDGRFPVCARTGNSAVKKCCLVGSVPCRSSVECCGSMTCTNGYCQGKFPGDPCSSDAECHHVGASYYCSPCTHTCGSCLTNNPSCTP